MLAEIEESKKKLDIREEDPEVTVLRVLSMLRLLKYKPPQDISAQFREGLLEGHKLVRTKTKDYSISMTVNLAVKFSKCLFHLLLSLQGCNPYGYGLTASLCPNSKGKFHYVAGQRKHHVRVYGTNRTKRRNLTTRSI